jgi:hypothetical protein
LPLFRNFLFIFQQNGNIGIVLRFVSPSLCDRSLK